MKLGVVFPQTEIGSDPSAIRDYAQTAEELGYTHILAYDHVLGAGTERRPNWKGAYTAAHPFHEPFVLFGFLAGLTSQVELVTGVIILPQRQTALVAKQAAAVDVLSGGRLRLGVGVGWNPIEFVALGEDYDNRGKRIEEQITLLRALWADEVIDFKGEWHEVRQAGINPLPPRRSIPIWIGGEADVVLRRAARVGDGWFPQMKPDRARESMEKLRAFAEEAGREPGEIGIEARINLREGTPDDWRAQLEAWRDMGATHAGVNTMGMGLANPQAHIEAIRDFRERVWPGE
jgi:probable F420-dependent oxidoreductase